MPKVPPSFLLWPNGLQEPYSAVLTKLTGLSARQRISILEGKPWQGDFPPVEFAFSPDFPDNTVLSDDLMNPNGLIVASDRLQKFLVARQVPLVEYQQVQLKNHKGKPAATYFLVNPLAPIDCLDRDASGAQEMPDMPGEILTVQRHVIREEDVPRERVLFRIAGYTESILVRRDLADAIATEFPGMQFREL